MGWVQNAQATLLLEKYMQEEIRRLDEKARLMRDNRFDERDCAPDTSAQWLAIFQKDEPAVKFALSAKKPRKAPL